jgi:hypothetical protein
MSISFHLCHGQRNSIIYNWHCHYSLISQWKLHLEKNYNRIKMLLINHLSNLCYIIRRSSYRVPHIRCRTARHERGCAACPRCEQGKAAGSLSSISTPRRESRSRRGSRKSETENQHKRFILNVIWGVDCFHVVHLMIWSDEEQNFMNTVTRGESWSFSETSVTSGWSRSRDNLPSWPRQNISTEKCLALVICFSYSLHGIFAVPKEDYIGCPTSGAGQRAMREAAPHARGVSKARQL